ncbi:MULTISPECIES: DUF4436 family protein [unclassified Rathayibacter]|uniref:DUF4436 family protein n=1 Tax=unclassified Rathayibacter TaxID=2609250 RepID=UPI0010536988|nr:MULTISPECIES: DUF4436 family protein [unclassified Rathayibacter]QHC68763.1 DUF4436 domain-containing protein [Rathayibacter sp. VKM Ac-2759]TCL77904.1 uncharacterized protein DUF4436 [Rathayibacter sp. PhB192]TCM23752.1 uncharacterized protein DUF4436 [Rathayibacter sp. PhB179]
MIDARPRPTRRRWPVVVAVVAAALLYATVVLTYAGGIRESSDGCETVIAGDDPVTVKLQPAAVNAARQRLEFQLTLVPSESLTSSDGYTATETISLVTFPVDGSSVLTFPAGEVLESSTQSDYAEGIVEEWPFDSYRADLTTFAFTGEDDHQDGHEHTALPTRVCLDDAVPGWQLHTVTIEHPANTVPTAGGLRPLPSVEITATRSASTVAFGIVLLGLMAATPVLVLFVAISAYTGRRKVEATLTSWIGAMLFAVIPLRNFLPGAPPVGSWIDYLVVLWVIAGLVTGLAIYILAWNRWGHGATSGTSSVSGSDGP